MITQHSKPQIMLMSSQLPTTRLRALEGAERRQMGKWSEEQNRMLALEQQILETSPKLLYIE